jgi:hypothetical protein
MKCWRVPCAPSPYQRNVRMLPGNEGFMAGYEPWRVEIAPLIYNSGWEKTLSRSV